MALILVVEQENRYIERIRDALTSEGWQVRAVGGSQEALTSAEREPPQLVLVSRESEGSDRLFQAFSRRTGGPGVVALLPESATHLEEPAADDALAKPFTDQDLRLAVRRGLKPKTPSSPSPPQAPESSGGDQQFSAEDIFGDLVAEMESEIQGSAPQGAAPSGPATETPPSRGPEAPKTVGGDVPKPPPRAAPERRKKARTKTDELDLEKTLSGLRRDVELGSRPDRPSSQSAPQAAEAGKAGETPASATSPDPGGAGTGATAPSPRKSSPTKKTKKSDTELDVDALLSETLSSIDLPTPKKKKKTSPPPAEAAPTEPEPRPAPEPAVEAEQPPRPAEPHGEREEASLADLLLDEDDVPPPTQVQPPPDLADPPSFTAPPSRGDRAAGGAATGEAAPGPTASEGAPPEPTLPEAADETDEMDEMEISFSELSASSLQEVPESLAADPETGVESPPRLDELGALEGDGLGAEELGGDEQGPGPLTAPAAPTAGEELRERSGTGASLAEWLESGEDSMFVPEDSPPDTPGQAPTAGSDESGSPAEDGAASSPGRRFGQYTLLDRIAVGGMAEVWKARSTGIEGFQKTVAIKKILPHLTDNDDFVNMFIDEAKLAAQLSHPNIIHIYDLGKIGDHFYIAMEYVEGKNLRALLNESRRKGLPLPRGLALLIAARLASALDHAHRKKDFEDRELGLVHRDVSPQNVLISDEGDIKLCDFGIVKAVSKASQTQMGALKGKLQYMSPEQAWGKDVDARSDLFSLGAILFEMLTGRRLFTGDSEISVLEAVRQCRVVAPREVVPQIPESIEAITLRALTMEPDDRYQTAGEMQQELEEVLYSVKPAPSPADLAEFLRRLAEAPESDGSDLVRAPDAAAEPAPGAGAEASGARGPKEGATREGPTREAPRDEKPPAAGVGDPGQEALSSLPSVDGAAEPGPVEASPSSEPSSPERTPPAGSAPSPAADPGRVPDDLAATAMPAMADYDLDELEEGGGRGRVWLVVLIVALLAAGAALYYLYSHRPPPPPSTSPAEVPEAEAPTEPRPSPLDEVDPDSPGPDLGDDVGDTGEDTRGTVGVIEEGGEGGTSPSTRTTSASRSPPPPQRDTERASERTAPRPQAAAPPRPSRREPTPAVPAESEDPPAATTTGTDPPAPGDPPSGAGTEAAAARSEPTTPQAPFALREGPLPAPPPTRSNPSATAETTSSEPSSSGEGVVLRGPPEGEGESEPESLPETRAAREPEPPVEPRVREGDLVGPGPGVTPPVLVSYDKPRYPPLARRMKVEGDVVVSLLVDETGRVVETRLVQGVREGVGLHQVALDAARRARYRPATKNGVRVRMWTTLRIPFRL